MYSNNTTRYWLNVLLSRVSVNSLLFCICSNLQLFVSVGNMLFCKMYQSFLNSECLCLDKKNISIVCCVWLTIFNTLFLYLCHLCKC